MVSYEAEEDLADLEVAPTVTAIDKIRTHTAAELETVNVDPIYSTIACEAAEQTPLPASVIHITFIRSFEGVAPLFLYGLPASTFGFVRPIKIFRKGRPVPFMTTVLDAALPTGLITSVYGRSSTVLQRLKYVVRGRRQDQEFESDEIDLTGGELPPLIEVTIRRKSSAKLNRKKMR